MPPDDMADGHFEPLHAAHAIEQVVISVQFSDAWPAEDFVAMRRLLGVFRAKLPAKTDIRTMVFAIGGPVGSMSPGPADQPAGLQMSSMAADGSVAKELRFDARSITYRSTLYTRWAEVKVEATEYLSAILRSMPSSCRISTVGLTYVDKFVWKGSTAEVKPLLLLSEASAYICPHVFKASDLWHSHTGIFLRPDRFTKRLLNVNADCVDEARDEELARVISISTIANDMFDQPGMEPLTTEGGADPMAFVDRRLEQLHNDLKQVFANVVNSTMGKRIALTTPDGK